MNNVAEILILKYKEREVGLFHILKVIDKLIGEYEVNNLVLVDLDTGEILPNSKFTFREIDTGVLNKKRKWILREEGCVRGLFEDTENINKLSAKLERERNKIKSYNFKNVLVLYNGGVIRKDGIILSLSDSSFYANRKMITGKKNAKISDIFDFIYNSNRCGNWGVEIKSEDNFVTGTTSEYVYAYYEKGLQIYTTKPLIGEVKHFEPVEKIKYGKLSAINGTKVSLSDTEDITEKYKNRIKEVLELEKSAVISCDYCKNKSKLIFKVPKAGYKYNTDDACFECLMNEIFVDDIVEKDGEW